MLLCVLLCVCVSLSFFFFPSMGMDVKGLRNRFGHFVDGVFLAL